MQQREKRREHRDPGGRWERVGEGGRGRWRRCRARDAVKTRDVRRGGGDGHRGCDWSRRRREGDERGQLLLTKNAGGGELREGGDGSRLGSGGTGREQLVELAARARHLFASRDRVFVFVFVFDGGGGVIAALERGHPVRADFFFQ